MSTAGWLLFTPGENNNAFTVHAMAGSTSQEKLGSSSTEELLKFLKSHDQAKTYLVSTNSGQITDPIADKIESSSGSAVKYQLWRETNSSSAVLGIGANGDAVDILRSKLTSDLLAFLGKYSGAKSCEVSALGDVVPNAAPGKSGTVTKPQVEWINGCLNFGSRNGTKITAIIVHYTTTDNIESPIGHFLNKESQVSAHYIIGKDGRIVQMVADSDKAWHCGSFNPHAIGIEHVAESGDRLTIKQEQASASLIKWLVHKYGISPNQILGHGWTPGNNTNCPGDLWPNVASLEKWVRAKL
jgi:N-acetylmuramoyl-L-alanine amidase